MGKYKKIWNNIYDYINLTIKLIINLGKIFKSKRNLHQDNFDKVLILGNGPSLKNINIDIILKNVSQVVCVNFFPLKDERFFAIKPKYLCLMDGVYFRNTPDRLKKSMNELYKVLEKVDWELKVVTFWENKLPVKNKNITYIELSNIVYKEDFLRKQLYSKNLASTGFQNVVIGAIYFAINGGAKEIYLAGVDNSEFKDYRIDEKNKVYCLTEHHYGNEKIYFDDIKEGEFYKQLSKYCLMFEQYYFLADYAKKYTKTNIINLNPYSYVDVFEKTTEYYEK